ncbi:MAG: DUF1175 domain-containing protein [Leptospiraceae bacterium]|nr:DUF1175 domain-containing protein [Leptospiraceae bacterium]MDW8306753.1 DUF1175 family protein [Leptospiraceae bacterium]
MPFGPSKLALLCVFAANLIAEIHTNIRKLSPGDQEWLRKNLELLALNLYYRQENKLPNSRWSTKNRDCAGLLRYLLWEAQQSHDERWQNLHGSPYTISLPLGKKDPFFITQIKSFPAKAFIKNYTRLVSRQINESLLRRGDILYFEQANANSHLMLLLYDSQLGWHVIYHTGQPKNEIRLVQLNDLFSHASTWHPSPQNPNFKGVFRFLFLD